jgi:4-carboxymuconolactone decarboxylase
LLVARYWTSQFVWWAHKRIALDAGLDGALVDAVAGGHTLPHLATLPGDVAAVYGFAHDLLQKKQVSDTTHAALVSHYGERGVVEVMGTISYYTLVSMCLNVDQYPLPEGAQAEPAPL